MDLIAFLAARLDEDEEAARAATSGPWRVDPERLFSGRYRVVTADYNEDPRSGAEAGDIVVSGDDVGGVELEDAAHIARHDPARVLAEVEVKREIVAEHASEDGDCSACGRASWEENPGAYLRDEPEMADVWRPAIWPCRTVRLLTLPYADHKDYREEWRPRLTATSTNATM